RNASTASWRPLAAASSAKPSSGTPPSGSGAPSPAPPQNSASPQAESDRSTANTERRRPLPATEPSTPWSPMLGPSPASPATSPARSATTPTTTTSTRSSRSTGRPSTNISPPMASPWPVTSSTVPTPAPKTQARSSPTPSRASTSGPSSPATRRPNPGNRKKREDRENENRALRRMVGDGRRRSHLRGDHRYPLPARQSGHPHLRGSVARRCCRARRADHQRALAPWAVRGLHNLGAAERSPARSPIQAPVRRDTHSRAHPDPSHRRGAGRRHGDEVDNPRMAAS